MKKSLGVGVAYAFVHFSVEVASFFLLYSKIGTISGWWIIAFLFDALAFVPQSIYGMISDKYPKLNLGFIGCCLMIVSLFIKNDWFSVSAIATGNALVHVNGAQHTLRGTKGRITPNSIFIGAGSWGVIAGQLLGKSGADNGILISIFLLVLSAVTVCLVQKYNRIENKVAEFKIAAGKSIAIVALFSFAVVAIRGYIAYAIPIEWNKTVIQSVALFVFMGIGKMLGGVLADIIGYKKVAFISLAGALPFLLAGNTNMLLSLIGVALFSMTMPITVAMLASLFPKQLGFAFGITTFGLFVGTAPAFFIMPESLFAHQVTVAVLTALALPLVILCIKKERLL